MLNVQEMIKRAVKYNDGQMAGKVFMHLWGRNYSFLEIFNEVRKVCPDVHLSQWDNLLRI